MKQDRPVEERAPFVPAWVGAVDLADADVGVTARPAPDGSSYERAVLLVLRHHEPLGFVDVALEEGRIADDEVRRSAEVALAAALETRAPSEDLGRWDGPPHGAWRSTSVVLCTRDRPAQATGAIEALLALDHPAFDIVVVDNAPTTDGTERAVQELVARTDVPVRYVCEPLPGLSNARNAGLRAAQGDIVAFTDDDIRVSPWWLRAIARGFCRDESVVCVTGSVFTATLDSPFQALFEQAVGTASKWGFAPRRYDKQGDGTSILHPYQLGVYGGGGNAAFDRAWLLATGGLDPALGAGTCTHGGEDLDAFLRVVTSGHSVAHEPAALVWHLHATDADAIRSQTFAYGVGLGAVLGKTAFTRTHGPAMLRRSVAGVRYLFSPTSAKNVEKVRYPLGLTLLELAGIGWGPAAYVRSHRASRRAPSVGTQTGASAGAETPVGRPLDVGRPRV